MCRNFWFRILDEYAAHIIEATGSRNFKKSASPPRKKEIPFATYKKKSSICHGIYVNLNIREREEIFHFCFFFLIHILKTSTECN